MLSLLLLAAVLPGPARAQDFYGEAMHWMVTHGVITGMDDGTLAPGAEDTRAQIAAIFMRFCEEMTE